MKPILKEQLPLLANPATFDVTEERLALFRRSFQASQNFFPPTWAALGLQGVFQLINDLEVDWRRLLHASQSFSYHTPLTAPTQATSQTKLTDYKFRGGVHWLNFENELRHTKSKELIVTSRSLILVRENA